MNVDGTEQRYMMRGMSRTRMGLNWLDLLVFNLCQSSLELSNHWLVRNVYMLKSLLSAPINAGEL
jgi:hypothetical protein